MEDGRVVPHERIEILLPKGSGEGCPGKPKTTNGHSSSFCNLFLDSLSSLDYLSYLPDFLFMFH